MILYYYLKAICIKIEINFNVQPGAGKGEVAKKIICNISCTILTNCTYDPIYSELFMYINYISMVFFLSWNETWNSIKKVIVQFFRLDLIGNSMERFSVMSATQPAALTFPRVLHHTPRPARRSEYSWGQVAFVVFGSVIPPWTSCLGLSWVPPCIFLCQSKAMYM